MIIRAGKEVKTGMNILIVDDEEEIRNMLSRILTKEGHEVTGVSSGEEAFDLFREKPYHLVISDILMEGMSGIELLKKIKKLDPNTQFLIITAYPTTETVISAIRAGAYDYLVKPFKNLDLIKATVDRAIEKIHFVIEKNNMAKILEQNIGELEHLKRIFWDMAIQDNLTGLHSSRYFHDILLTELLRSRRHDRFFSLLFMDIDYFKDYNKIHGHSEGDNVLREMSEILKRRFRKSDVIARYGGDEFVILLPETEKKGARIVAEEICKLIEHHPFRGRETQPEGKITVSLGVASFPEDGEDPDSLINTARNLSAVGKTHARYPC
jgi:diguanylate cyclase (GGDEF)-like protein